MRMFIKFRRQKIAKPLLKLKRAIPISLKIAMFLVCCLVLPFAVAIKIIHPGLIATGEETIALATSDPRMVVPFLLVALSLGGFMMFIINGAFTFMRSAAGYEVRKNGTILSWLINKAKKRFRNRWPT